MSDDPKITVLDGGAKKDALADSLRTLRANIELLIEGAELTARVTRAKYLALIAQGFTEAQALELCK